MHGWVNVGVCCLLVVAWAYGRLIHARGPLSIGLRALRHARGPAGPVYQQATNTHIHQTMHPIILRSNPPSSHSPIHPFIHLFIHYLSVYAPIHPPTYLSTLIPIQPTTHPFTHTSIHSFIHPSIHPSIHVDAWMSR